MFSWLQFLAFWQQLSEHCQKAPNSVLFEILNEPNKKMTPALWNQYLAEALAIIREKNPVRTVIVGPAFWNSVDHLNELVLPESDRHLIVTVHYYLPMSFTHQGASWAGQKDKHDIAWPNSEKDRATLNANFDKVAAWAKAHNRPIYLGEFGAYDKAPMESRIRYTDAVARAAEARGWSWGYWQFDGDFILWDMKRDAFVEPILHALIPAGAKKCNASALPEAARYFSGRRKLVFVISDFLTPLPQTEALFQSLARHDVAPIIIRDPAQDRDIPRWGFMEARDLETGRTRLLFMRPKLRETWLRKAQEHHAQLVRLCGRYGRRPFIVEGRLDPLALGAYLMEG